jgi:hypothetical protein
VATLDLQKEDKLVEPTPNTTVPESPLSVDLAIDYMALKWVSIRSKRFPRIAERVPGTASAMEEGSPGARMTKPDIIRLIKEEY